MTKPIFPHKIRSFAGMHELVELALDLRWSWNHGADDIWRRLASELWDLTRNPWVILQTVAPERLKEMCADAKFSDRVKKLAQERRASRTAAAWFQKAYPRRRFHPPSHPLLSRRLRAAGNTLNFVAPLIATGGN